MASLTKFLSVYFEAHSEEVAHSLAEQTTSDLVNFLSEFSPSILVKLMASWSSWKCQDFLNELEGEKRLEVLKLLPMPRVLKFIRSRPDEEHQFLIQSFSQQRRIQFERLLQFSEKSFGAICDPEFLSGRPEDSVKTIRKMVEANPNAFHDYVYIEDENSKLVGILSFHQIFLSPLMTEASQIMKRQVVSFRADDFIAAKFMHPSWDLFSALPIHNAQGVMLGIVRSGTIKELSSQAGHQWEGPLSLAADAFGETLWIGLSGLKTILSHLVEGQKQDK